MVDRWLRRTARMVGALAGAFAALVAIQFLRLRRMEFLPTAGVGIDRAEQALPARIAQHLADARGRPVRVTNHGWSGARMADLLHDQLARTRRWRKRTSWPW